MSRMAEGRIVGTEERDGKCEPSLEEQIHPPGRELGSVPDTHACILTVSGSIIGCPASSPHTCRTGVSSDIYLGLSPVRH